MASVGAAPVPIAWWVMERRVVGIDRFAGGGAAQSLTCSMLPDPGMRMRALAIAAGAFPRELRVSTDGQTLYLTNFGSNSLQVMDVGASTQAAVSDERAGLFPKNQSENRPPRRQPDHVRSGTFLAFRSDLGSEYLSLDSLSRSPITTHDNPGAFGRVTMRAARRRRRAPGAIAGRCRGCESTRLHCKRRSARREKDLQGHFHDPGIRHSEAAGCRFGDIDEPVAVVRAAVVDSHHDAVAAFYPPDPYVGAEGQRTMGGVSAPHRRFATGASFP